jgi:hypothetical protein
VSDEAQETRPNQGGRPSDYTQELADRICSELAEGKSLRTVCRADDMPDKSTVFRWIRSIPEFRDQYARAKEESADAHVEDTLDIADDASNDWMEIHDKDNPGYRFNGEHVNRSKLRIDTRKWIASKLKPKRYGDKVAVGGAEDLPPIQTADMTETEVARRIAFALQRGTQAQEKPH